MEDYFAMESLLLARLKDQVHGVTIRSLWGEATIQEDEHLAPAVMVRFVNDIPGMVTQDSQSIMQHWLCMVVSNDAPKGVGLLVHNVQAALFGWKAGKQFSGLTRIPTNLVPETSPNGIFYFPMVFSTKFVFTVHS